MNITHPSITPEVSDQIRHEAELAAEAFTEGAQTYVCELQPGTGSRYLMVLSVLTRAAGKPEAVGGRYVLSILNFKTAYSTSLGYTDISYAAEKWTNNNAADGAAVATFLNHLNTAMLGSGQ